MHSDITPNVQRKQQAIIEGAAALFDAQGYHSTSMVEIARSVGISKPTLYHYYASKDRILFEVHDQLMDLLLTDHHARVAAAHDDDPMGLLRAALQDLLRAVASRRGQMRVFVESYRELSASYRPLVEAKRDEYAELMTDLLRRAQASGSARPLHPTVARLSIFGMVSWAYQWFDPRGALGVDEIMDVMWDLLMHGMSTTVPEGPMPAPRER